MVLINFFLPLLHVHAHEGESFWDEFAAVAFDPAHILAEFLFTIVFDFLIITLIWGIIFKKFILPKMKKQIHDELDEEHGITRHD